MHRPEIESLHLADVTLPEWHPLAGQLCVVNAFVIRHPEGPVLVDTGVGAGHEGIDRLYQPVRQALAEALAAVELRVADVVAVINTHLHFDHCGENLLFAGLPIYVQAAEYEAAAEPLYTVREWVDFPGARFEQLSGETDLLPGLSVIPTPGHTPGHQSVLVEGENGLSVIAGQAVYSAAEFADDEPAVGGDWDDAAYARSLALLREMAPQRVYFSHDTAIWER